VWAAATSGPAAWDVAYVMVSSMQPDDIDKHDLEIMEHYYQSLTKKLSPKAASECVCCRLLHV
jgi:hypothetical protein